MGWGNLSRAAGLALEAFGLQPRSLDLVSISENVSFRVRTASDDLVLRLHRPGYNSLAELESESGFQNQEAVQLPALEREAEANRALFGATKLVLFMNLFFGGATGLLELMIKTWVIYMVAIAVGVAFPRFRVDQSIRFFLKVPTVIGIAAIVYVQMVIQQ